MTRRVELRAEPGFEDMLAITSNLRARDKAELFCTRYGTDEARLAAEIAATTVATGAFRWGAYIDGKPVAAIGAFPRWPNVWSAWAFGTDEWPRVALALTRHVTRFMLPAIYRSGFHRMDCNALAANTDTHKWLRALGAKQEKTLDNFGKNGEGFVGFVWTRANVGRIVNRAAKR